MGKKYRTLEGIQASVDTKTQLTTRGSEGTITGGIKVPAGARSIEALIVATGYDYVAAGSACAIVRLSGDGIQGGEKVYCVGAAGQEGTTGGQMLQPAKVIPTGPIPVIPTNEVQIHVEMVGEDIGEVFFAVTIVFI